MFGKCILYKQTPHFAIKSPNVWLLSPLSIYHSSMTVSSQSRWRETIRDTKTVTAHALTMHILWNMTESVTSILRYLGPQSEVNMNTVQEYFKKMKGWNLPVKSRKPIEEWENDSRLLESKITNMKQDKKLTNDHLTTYFSRLQTKQTGEITSDCSNPGSTLLSHNLWQVFMMPIC